MNPEPSCTEYPGAVARTYTTLLRDSAMLKSAPLTAPVNNAATAIADSIRLIAKLLPAHVKTPSRHRPP